MASVFDIVARRLLRRTTRRELGATAALHTTVGAAVVAGARCEDGRRRCGGVCCDARFECMGESCVMSDLPTLPPVELCLDGTALCATDAECNVLVGEACCAGTCLNVTCNTNACGACNHVCDGDTRCVAGTCQQPGTCPAGMGTCGAGCCTWMEGCGDDGACVPPQSLDFLGVGLACYADEQGGACSLQRVYGIDWAGSCATDIGLNQIETILEATRAPEVIESVERILLASPDAISLAEASDDLEIIEAVLGFVLPVDCIEGLAEILSQGQLTMLKLCLADADCTEQLVRSLSF